jgi:hypothetical protein
LTASYSAAHKILFSFSRKHPSPLALLSFSQSVKDFAVLPEKIAVLLIGELSRCGLQEVFRKKRTKGCPKKSKSPEFQSPRIYFGIYHSALIS